MGSQGVRPREADLRPHARLVLTERFGELVRRIVVGVGAVAREGGLASLHESVGWRDHRRLRGLALRGPEPEGASAEEREHGEPQEDRRQVAARHFGRRLVVELERTQ